MEKNTYEGIAKLLKILAKIFGALLIVYGCIVGVLGFGPDGPSAIGEWRLIGLFVLLQGALYFISNSKIRKKLHFSVFYLAATILPGLILIGLTVFNIFTAGTGSFTKAGGLISIVFLLPLSLLAPLSLVFSILGVRTGPGFDGDK
jgi:hypothetical protein